MFSSALLREMRERRCLSVEQVSVLAAVHVSHIVRWESHEIGMRAETLALVARDLGFALAAVEIEGWTARAALLAKSGHICREQAESLAANASLKKWRNAR